jgi:hypothetical protein
MRSSDNIEKLLGRLRLDTSRSADEKILSDAGKALETAADVRRMATRGVSRWAVAFEVVRRAAVKFGVAAAVVITATSIWVVVEKTESPCGVTPSGNANVGQVTPSPKASIGMGAINAKPPADVNSYQKSKK